MAKKKVMQQLDLFSMFEPAPIPEKQEQEPMPVADNLEETIVPSIVVEETIIEAVQLPTVNESPVVFSDGKISVKIKAKPAPKKEEPLQKENKPAAKKADKKPAEQTSTTINPLRKRGRKSFKDMDAEVDLIEVPDEEVLKKKLYYSIGEVAAFFKVNTSLIRAWENEFDILKPRKNRKGDRFFRVEDIKSLQMIYYLLRNRKFSVDGAKKYIKSNKKGADTNHQLTQSLKKFRSFLLELKANLEG